MSRPLSSLTSVQLSPYRNIHFFHVFPSSDILAPPSSPPIPPSYLNGEDSDKDKTQMRVKAKLRMRTTQKVRMKAKVRMKTAQRVRVKISILHNLQLILHNLQFWILGELGEAHLWPKKPMQYCVSWEEWAWGSERLFKRLSEKVITEGS